MGVVEQVHMVRTSISVTLVLHFFAHESIYRRSLNHRVHMTHQSLALRCCCCCCCCLTQCLLDDRVVSESLAGLADLAEAALVDELANGLQVGIARKRCQTNKQTNKTKTNKYIVNREKATKKG